MDKIVCPYCFATTSKHLLHLRCQETCPTVEVFPPSRRCPHGSEPVRSRFCPECSGKLEYDYLNTEGRTIALIGASSAGKSTYIGVLVHELRNKVGAAFNGMSLEFVGDQSRQRYEQDFGGPLYRKGLAPNMTMRVRRDLLPPALLLTLKFPQPRRFGRASAIKPAMMTFFDTAGEDVDRGEDIGRLARYLDSAEGIILLVDPLQIPGVSASVPGGAGGVGAAEQSKVVTLLAALLREQRGLPPTKRIKTPLAIALSKTDALNGMFPEHSPLRRRHEHPGAYDDSDGRHVHDEVRAWLQHWHGAEFDNIVANNFSDYRYFGLSALGTPPDGRTLSAAGVHPLRVEDPLLWLLARFNLIPTARSR